MKSKELFHYFILNHTHNDKYNATIKILDSKTVSTTTLYVTS